MKLHDKLELKSFVHTQIFLQLVSSCKKSEATKERHPNFHWKNYLEKRYPYERWHVS